MECFTDPDCDDSNVCTDDNCSAGTCAYFNNTDPCDDDLYCNVGEACSGGSCTGGSARDCDDALACTTDTCNEGTDQCNNTLNAGFDLDDCGNFSLIIDHKDMDRALSILDGIKTTIDAKVVSYTPDVAVITVFGPHLRERPRTHGMMFSCIASVGISSLAISSTLARTLRCGNNPPSWIM